MGRVAESPAAMEPKGHTMNASFLTSRFAPARAIIAGAALLLFAAQAGHAQSFTSTVFASGSGVSGTQPDSITIGGGHVFVEYGNGTNSSAPLGTAGASTIAEYDYAGNAVASFSALGSVDGLRYNPSSNLLYVLQNQDGNPALETIDPTNGLTTKYAYPADFASNPGRGFDDATFTGGKTFLSYTNPSGTGDAVIYSATLGNGIANLGSPVLSFGDSGLNTATGKTGTTVLNDPDSLDQTPNGSLLQTSGDDGSLTTVTNPGTANQSVRFVSLTDSAGSSLSGLDDTVFAPSAGSSLLVADTKNDVIYKVTGPFQAGSAYSSIGSTNSLDSVDLTTGLATSISGGLFQDGSSPHGLGFLPAAVPEVSTTVSFGLLLVLGLGGLAVAARKKSAA